MYQSLCIFILGPLSFYPFVCVFLWLYFVTWVHTRSLNWSHPQFIDGGGKIGVYRVLSSMTISLSRCFQHGPPSVPTMCQACWGIEWTKQSLVSKEPSAGLNHFWGVPGTCGAGTQYMCAEQQGMPKALLGKKEVEMYPGRRRACTILYLKPLGHTVPGEKRDFFPQV